MSLYVCETWLKRELDSNYCNSTCPSLDETLVGTYIYTREFLNQLFALGYTNCAYLYTCILVLYTKRIYLYTSRGLFVFNRYNFSFSLALAVGWDVAQIDGWESAFFIS